jgi:hypothetical protein
MKKFPAFMVGILSLMLVFGFVLTGCDKDVDDDNPFTGTWSGEIEMGEKKVAVTLTITRSTWEAQELSKGTYIRNGNIATMTVTHEWEDDSKSWKVGSGEATATVSGNTLVSSGNFGGSSIKTFTFTRQ